MKGKKPKEYTQIGCFKCKKLVAKQYGKLKIVRAFKTSCMNC